MTQRWLKGPTGVIRSISRYVTESYLQQHYLSRGWHEVSANGDPLTAAPMTAEELETIAIEPPQEWRDDKGWTVPQQPTDPMESLGNLFDANMKAQQQPDQQRSEAVTSKQWYTEQEIEHWLASMRRTNPRWEITPAWLTEQFRAAFDKGIQLSDQSAAIAERDKVIALRVEQLSQSRATIAERDATIATLNDNLATRYWEGIRQENANLVKRIHERDATIKHWQRLYSDAATRIEEKDATVAELLAALEKIADYPPERSALFFYKGIADKALGRVPTPTTEK